MSNTIRKPVALTLTAALAGGLALSGSTFAMSELSSGYLLGAQEAEKATEGKCGEGKCGGKEGGGHTIEAMDTDKSGGVSQAEFAAAHDGDASRFAGYDADASGAIDEAELKVTHEAKSAGHQGAKAGTEAKADMEGKCGEGKCGAAD